MAAIAWPQYFSYCGKQMLHDFLAPSIIQPVTARASRVFSFVSTNHRRRSFGSAPIFWIIARKAIASVKPLSRLEVRAPTRPSRPSLSISLHRSVVAHRPTAVSRPPAASTTAPSFDHDTGKPRRMALSFPTARLPGSFVRAEAKSNRASKPNRRLAPRRAIAEPAKATGSKFTAAWKLQVRSFRTLLTEEHPEASRVRHRRFLEVCDVGHRRLV